MNLHLVLIVDKTKDIVAGDGVTTSRELKLTDVLLIDIDGLLAVEVLGYDKEFGLFFLLRLFLRRRFDKRHILSPAATCIVLLVLALHLVQVFLA